MFLAALTADEEITSVLNGDDEVNGKVAPASEKTGKGQTVDNRHCPS